jgi:hypothetical protein
VALTTAANFARAAAQLELMRFVLFDERALEAFRKAMEALSAAH